MFDVERAKRDQTTAGYVAMFDEIAWMAEALKAFPDMLPIAQKFLSPVLANGHGPEQPMTGKPKKHISEATRAKMRAAAAKRWGKKTKK